MKRTGGTGDTVTLFNQSGVSTWNARGVLRSGASGSGQTRLTGRRIEWTVTVGSVLLFSWTEWPAKYTATLLRFFFYSSQ